MDGDGALVGGRYRLLRRLGAGGMAEVWLAADLRLGDKHVAVKRLLGYRADSPEAAQDVERARREALAASRLNHPNLVAVTDFVAEDGEPFIVMEYVDGVTLDELIGAHGLPVDRAARIIGQIAAAVAEAHDAGIIHRDIKPANIMVTRRDVAKLADFGIARSVGDARLTRTGFFTGTVAYLAPELLDGSDATSASDVWALGAVLFEAVEGRPAFDGDTTAAVIASIVLKDLPVPRRATGLAPLLARMLTRDPAARVGIADVVDELAAVIRASAPTTRTGPTTTPIVAPPAGPVPPSPPGFGPPRPDSAPSGPPRRSRPGWWVAAALVLVLIAAGVVALVLSGGGGDSPVAGRGSSTGAGRTASPSTTPPSGGPDTAASGTSSGSGSAPSGGVRVLAHRGGREKYTEETLPALVQAAKDGYGVETDVRWTSDGVAVLVHDATTKGNLDCDGGPYRIASTSWTVLERSCRTPADASPDGSTYPIPTFDAVATALGAIPGATIFAEVKVTQTASQVTSFLNILRRHGLLDHAVITSFYGDELVKMRDAAKPLGSTVRLMRFVSDTRTSATSLRAAGVGIVAVEASAATRQYVSAAKAAGLGTVVWTVDTEAQWAAARATGADLVITDVPGAYLTWLADH